MIVQSPAPSKLMNLLVNFTDIVKRYISTVFVCVVIPFILDVRLVDVPAGVTQDFYTFLVRCLPYFSRENDSAVPFPRRPRSRILCTNKLIFLHFDLLGIRVRVSQPWYSK